MGQFTGLILVLLFFAFLLRVDFIFYIAYVCMGIYGWNRWMTPRLLAKLKVGRAFTTHAFWGEKTTVTIKIENPSRISIPWLLIHESLALELRGTEEMNRVVSIDGRKTAVYTYHIQSHRRGYYQLGPMHLSTSDLFGFLPDQVGTIGAEYITIYPRIIPLTQLGLPSRLPFGTIASRQRLFADPARPMGIRDYRSGDSLRQINWKASAHTRQLMVKTFEPAISLETAVLLNLHTNDYVRKTRSYAAEWAIEIAASLAAHLIDRRQPVGLLTTGVDPLQLFTEDESAFEKESGRLLARDLSELRTQNPKALLPPAIPPRNGRVHLMKVLERLARIEAEETISFNEWAIPACSHLSWGVTLLIITAKGDTSTCHTIHRLVRTGFNPVLITVEPDHNFDEVRERARRLGFLAFNISERHALDPWRQIQQGRSQ
jgi:uncharacterized protein (DUF58 family)